MSRGSERNSRNCCDQSLGAGRCKSETYQDHWTKACLKALCTSPTKSLKENGFLGDSQSFLVSTFPPTLSSGDLLLNLQR